MQPFKEDSDCFIADTVDVVVTTRNYAHFLADALQSVLDQTVPANNIIVVDDGSSDNPAKIVADFPGVTLVSLPGKGISAARNAGIVAASSKYLIFLDADDRLLPTAIEQGLACMSSNPGAAFVYGAFRFVSKDLRKIEEPRLVRTGTLAFCDLLRGNMVRMHAAVMYERAILTDDGGFDSSLPCCEDYDAYLRLAQKYRIACHRGVVAEYRLHGRNMSADATAMLKWHIDVLERYRPAESNVRAYRAWRTGISRAHRGYSRAAWNGKKARFAQNWAQRVHMARIAPGETLFAALRRLTLAILPYSLKQRLRHIRDRVAARRRGDIDFGDLARIRPVSHDYGFSRGTPIDRHYIDEFLRSHAADIKGRVLEFGSSLYTDRFGRDVTAQDVLNVLASAPGTTILGDISAPGLLQPDSYDCIIATQVLPYIYEPIAAIREMHRALRPGGVLLVTTPGLAPIIDLEWDCYWNLTVPSARRLFTEVFGAAVEVQSKGNAFAATCFIQGIAIEDVALNWIEAEDPRFPVNVAVRAVK
jgi:glycosyltransferase involved in cell wall biosynthesis/SAM-dependent methyltransferase